MALVWTTLIVFAVLGAICAVSLVIDWSAARHETQNR
jgi:hypothetical protein